MSGTIAVSYARRDGIYVKKVIGFVNFLRDNGYNAIMDEYLKQKQTAIDFNEMMSKMITSSNRVIAILSEEYKKRADSFSGGVGSEYRIIAEEIKSNPEKYVFIVFSDDSSIPFENLIPSMLGNREVIIVTNDPNDSWKDQLFSKLSGTPLYSFNSVSVSTTIPPTMHLTYGINSSKKLVKTQIHKLLIDNKSFWKQYGPSSPLAINDPLSDSVELWNSCKKKYIIPNNSRIIELFEKNISLFSEDEVLIFEKFKIHAFSFENNQIVRQDNLAVTTFPTEFEKMIEEDGND